MNDPHIRLDQCPGTVKDLEPLGIELREGLVLNVFDADGDLDDPGLRDDLIATGVVER